METSQARRLMDLMTGYWRTQAVRTAAELGLADRIGDGRRRTSELAAELAVDPDALGRLLHYLVSVDVLDGDDTHGFALTPMGALLRDDTPGSMRHYARLYGGEFYRAWGELPESIRTGRSGFGRVFGDELFPYLAADPGLSLLYDKAMVSGNAFFADVPRAYDFSGARIIVDVAGGHGALLTEILRRNPGARGVLFDTPHVIAETRRGELSPELAERTEFVEGDFFTAVPSGGDVYTASRILHGFDDDTCVRILAGCAAAMTPDARLLLLERLLPDEPATGGLGHGYNMHMLAVMGGGRERTRRAYEALLDKAGFALRSTRPLPLDTYLMVAERT